MKLTRKQALELHYQMWSDMKKELGNNPGGGERVLFKEGWCSEHFPDERIECNCFLCDYLKRTGGCDIGRKCPIVWPYGTCCENQYYYEAPISEILTLPEREVE